MGFLKNVARKGLMGAADLALTAAGQPEFIPFANMAIDKAVDSDLAKKGIKALVNHQFNFGKKKFSARDLIRKVKGLPDNIINKLPEQYQGIAKDIASPLLAEVGNVVKADDPFSKGVELYKKAKEFDIANAKTGIHDVLGKLNAVNKSVPNYEIGRLAEGILDKAAGGDISMKELAMRGGGAASKFLANS